MESVVISTANITKVAEYFAAKGIAFSAEDVKDNVKCLNKLVEVCDDENLTNELRTINSSRLNLILSRLKTKPSAKEEPKLKQPATAHVPKVTPKTKPVKLADDVPEEEPEGETEEPVDNVPDEKPKRGRKPGSKQSPKQPAKRKAKQTSEALHEEAVPQEVKPKLAPIEQSKNNMIFARPSLEIPIVEYEKAHAFEYLQALIDAYDFDKGKKQMGTAKKEKVERTEEVIANEKKEAAEVVKNLKDYHNVLVSDIVTFRNEHKDGQLKITDEGVKIVSKVVEEIAPENATEEPKKATKKTIEIPFAEGDLLKEFNEQSKIAFKYISKDFIADHYKSVLMSGVLNSRSVMSSGCFKLALADIEKIGILKNINVNITGNMPPIKLPKENSIDEYYWLLTNAKKLSNISSLKKAETAATKDKSINLHDYICGNASEVFAKRQGIINHIGYPHIKVVEAWNKALSNMSSPETDVEKMWLEVLKSSFMFDIIMYGTAMNPFVEAAFKVLINQYESSKLYFTKLFPISFMFTSLHMFCEGDKLETCLSNSLGLYKYESFTWCAKELSDVKCVIDVFNEQSKKPEKETEETPEEPTEMIHEETHEE